MTISISQLKEYWDLMISYYGKEHRRMRLLDSVDRGDLWKALGAKFPSYQILPDTNHTTYVKTNLLASIYSVVKAAQVMPTREADVGIIENINVALDCIWNLGNIGYYQFQAGERCALLNVGYTQVGWDEDLTAGSGDSFYKGNVTLKNINPIKFMRDPFAEDLDSAGYCVRYDTYHKSVFLENPKYRDEFQAYLAKHKGYSETIQALPELNSAFPKSGQKDYYTLFIFWVKNGAQVDEIHVIDMQQILYQKENIKPNCFPIAELYCNNPAGALIGASECVKIFANSVAYNLMDSIALTAEYKNQRPPKFVNLQSGLNVKSFAKHGDEADKTFIVNGDAQKAVHYHQFPQISPALPHIKQSLEQNIQLVSGVDGRYTGRDTGSIITTGGTEEMLNRVTLIDTPKIINYERYCKKLTQLILANFIEYCPTRKYFYKKPNSTKWDTVTVDFPKISSDTLFNYQINISSELPKTKQRIASMANMLMEKQMQYREQGSSVQLLTEEEWLMMQDLPNKEFMLERMGVQRLSDATEEVAQVLFQYANLVKNGMKPDDAILATANSLKEKRMGIAPEAAPVPTAAPELNMMGQI
jgi:hypothetical protein